MNDPLSQVIRWALILILIVTPWFFGGVFASTQGILLAAVSLLLLIDFVRTTMSAEDYRLIPSLILVLLAGILLGVFQLIPLRPALQSTFAPQSTDLRQQLTSPVLDSEGAVESATKANQAAARSLYPASTRENLALLFLASATCYLTSIYVKDARSLLILFAALAICGVAIGFFGIVQQLSSNGKIYWQMPLTYGGAIFGPYVNRNNAGGFLNLCVAATLGLLVYLTSRSDHDESYEHWSDSGQQRRTHYSQSPLLVQLNSAGIALLIGLGFLAGAIIVSASRGSMFAMIVATLVSAGMLLYQARSRRFAWTLVLAIGTGVPLMAWAGQTEAVQSRLSSIFGDKGEIQDARLANWPDALEASRDFRIAGSGLGTYRYVYALKQRWFIGEKWFFHAENQFIESLVDAGLIGLSLLITSIGLMVFSIARLYRSGRRTDMALAVAGAYALASQVVGGSFDFGLYLPANMMVLAAICGAVTGRSASQPSRKEAGDHRPARLTVNRFALTGWAMPLVGGLLLLGCFFGTIEIRRLAAIERITWKTPLEALREIREPEPIEQLIARLQPALQQRWDDAEAHRYMADLWMQIYRARAFQRLQQQLPPTDQREADLLWDRSAFWQLHAAIRTAERAGEDTLPLQEDAIVQESVRMARFHLEKSLEACPLIAHVHYAMAELSAAANESSVVENRYLARAGQLAPGDATLAFWSGVLDENSGRVDEAVKKWGRALMLGETTHRADIAERLATKYPNQLTELPDIPELLAAVALNPVLSPEQATSMLQRAAKAFDEAETKDAATLYTHSRVLLRLDELAASVSKIDYRDEAIQKLRKAVQQRPNADAWRWQLAELLLASGDVEAAHLHAKTLVQGADNSRHRDLLRRVNTARRRTPD